MAKRKDEVFSKIERARSFDTSSSCIPTQPEDNSSGLEHPSPHLEGELPSYLSELEKASEVVPEMTVSEINNNLKPNYKWPLKHVLP